jgi:hypothetical protein
MVLWGRTDPKDTDEAAKGLLQCTTRGIHELIALHVAAILKSSGWIIKQIATEHLHPIIALGRHARPHSLEGGFVSTPLRTMLDVTSTLKLRPVFRSQALELCQGNLLLEHDSLLPLVFFLIPGDVQSLGIFFGCMINVEVVKSSFLLRRLGQGLLNQGLQTLRSMVRKLGVEQRTEVLFDLLGIDKRISAKDGTKDAPP